MDHCEIQFHPETGQLMICSGAHLLGDLDEGRLGLHAFDRTTGHRYIITQKNDELFTNKITVH